MLEYKLGFDREGIADTEEKNGPLKGGPSLDSLSVCLYPNQVPPPPPAAAVRHSEGTYLKS